MSLLDDIRKDRDAGTDGPWEWNGDNRALALFVEEGCAPYFWEIATAAPTFFRSDMGDRLHQAKGNRHVNARRIARVPQMEAALLAADELARFVDLVHGSFGGGLVVTFTDSDVEQATAALTAYRAAIEAT